jgi:putative glycosyltransferase (TIGR04372 family)
MLFHVPCVLVNLLPLASIPHRNTDIAILKRYYSIKEKRILTYPEILSDDIFHSIHTKDYVNKSIIPIDNTDDEIKDVVIEMLEKLEKRQINDEYDKILQGNFKKLFKPNHLCYNFESKIGAKFMMKYTKLFNCENSHKNIK